MSRSCCTSPLLISRRMDSTTNFLSPPWQYYKSDGTLSGKTRSPSQHRSCAAAEAAEAADATQAEAVRARRDELAAAARARYNEWAMDNAEYISTLTASTSGAERETHVSLHAPRSREKEKELAGEWVGANQVQSQRERVQSEVDDAASRFQTNPPYPSVGPSSRNASFSYTSGYDYRQRQRSCEVAGTASSLSARPRTESGRVNEALLDGSLRDALGGGRWTADQKYGNPVVKLADAVGRSMPTPMGNVHRQPSKERWLVCEAGGFAATFPPSPPRSPMRDRRGAGHHLESFVDKPHASTEAALKMFAHGEIPGYNVLSGRGSPSHLSPSARRAAEAGFSATVPGQSPKWARPPPTGLGEIYIPAPTSPLSASLRSLRSTGQLPPSPVPAKSHFRSTATSPSPSRSPSRGEALATRAFPAPPFPQSPSSQSPSMIRFGHSRPAS